MLEQIMKIAAIITESFKHIWPYLVITIPLAVAVKVSGISRHIKQVFNRRPFAAILLATLVGAFSPFCSCGVIPVIASLLIGGVPLAPVMSFWLASPSMDPEIFFLSASMIGWPLALWRLGSTFLLSLGAGFITHILFYRGWLGNQILKPGGGKAPFKNLRGLIKDAWPGIRIRLKPALRLVETSAAGVPNSSVALCRSISCSTSPRIDTAVLPRPKTGSGPMENKISCSPPVSFKRRLVSESLAASTLVAKFMLLAFFLQALITLYVPQELILGLLGQKNPLAVVTAALIGLPAYTNNLAALGLLKGLLSQGMSPAAGLAFLIAGPTTTIPAMAAVWKLASNRVFLLYISFTLAGAVFFGFVYGIVQSLF